MAPTNTHSTALAATFDLTVVRTPSARRNESVEVDPARAARFDRILARRKRRSVHRGGFAPDLSHGPRDLGAIYEVVEADEAESVLFVSTLPLVDGKALMSLGRWREGFFDTVQMVLGNGGGAEVHTAIWEMTEGALVVQGAIAADPGLLEAVSIEEIEAPANVPLALNREDLLAREQKTLGLVREDLLCPDEIAELSGPAIAGDDLMGMQRLLEAGRADLITASALYVERRALAS